MRALRVMMAIVVVGAALAAVPAVAAESGLAAPGGADAGARAEVAQLTRATRVNDADGNKVFDDLDAAFLQAAPDARLAVIVSFTADTATPAGVAAVRDQAPQAMVDRTFTVVPAFAGRLTRDEAAAVAALAQVRQVELDSPGDLELETATAVMGADAVVDGLGVTGSLDGQEGVVTAQDVTVAILDTGFDTNHVDLEGKLRTFVDLADGLEEPYDSDGHGTHVASIVAGWGAGDPAQRGVAPGAGIVGLRIENESHAIAGYEWILANRDAYDIRAATISFGFGVASDGTTALERAVDAVWDAGVVCFKSNGNSGPGSSTMTVPAAARGILAIGSMLDPAGGSGSISTPAVGVGFGTKYGFALSEYSSRGPTTDGRVKPDLVAPGESITAADAGTTAGYITMSGTSMASPFAAGTTALVLAANPSLTPDQVREILTTTAQDWGRTGPDIDYGHGRIQVLDAVEAAIRAGGSEPPAVQRPDVPQHKAVDLVPGSLTGMSVTVTDITRPLSLTAIAADRVLTSPAGSRDGIVTHIRAVGPDGRPLQHLPFNADRQHHITFLPTVPGSYSFFVESPVAVTLDLSS